jgi:hypothetical protein
MKGEAPVVSQLSFSFLDTFISAERASSVHCIRVWVELRAGFEAMKTKLHTAARDMKQVSCHSDKHFHNRAIPFHFACRRPNKISRVAIRLV